MSDSQNVKKCPVLVVLWKFLTYSLLKGLFWEPRWPRHKISELYSVKFQKIGKYCPVLWTFFITTLSEGPIFLGVQVLRDKNPWTVFCANSDNYQWWKVLWNVVISLKSFEKLRKVSKSVEKFEKFWKVLESFLKVLKSFAKCCHFVRASVVSVS